MENLSADERKLVLPMMKNYIKKYTPAGDFEKSKVRVESTRERRSTGLCRRNSRPSHKGKIYFHYYLFRVS